MLKLGKNSSSFSLLPEAGMLRRMLLLPSMFGLLMLGVNPLSAQIDTGGITATATDCTGASESGATITLTNDGTGVVLSTKSTSSGTYSLNAIRPGTYTLRGEAAGFQTFVDNGLQVHVQNTLTVDI